MSTPGGATVTQLSDFRDRQPGWSRTAWELPALPAPPPTGTVTFLLTDIEGSTPRWELNPDAMAEAVSRHYEILDTAVAARGGVRPVEQGEGDSMVAVFARASDAVAAALAAQRDLVAYDWPEGAGLAVRMALHTGEARLREGLYYVGPSIIRCARLRSLAHGGQVLLSADAADLLVDGLPRDTALLPLGSHRLKGMRHPERVFQLAHPALPAQFPPLISLDALQTNLPAQPTSFVGRDAELAELVDLMAGHRLVTLAGAGGTGKTRLALQAATELPEVYPDGVWFADLAPLRSPDLVPRALMAAVGLDDSRGLDPIARTVEFLAGRRLLLVLDNCEHVTAAAAAAVGAVLAGCPGVCVLATSREPLGVGGELVRRVPPMPVGAEDAEATRLFVERAAEARPGFRVDADNAAVVAELCARLDGLPLAIELAAARVRALTPQRILDGLGQRFALLPGGSRSALPHQQTLAASMAWSHELLTEPQQVLLRRLSVFVGRFSLEAVEDACSAGPLTAWECLVLLADLVDRSLVLFDGEHYALLQTVREFAAAKLDAAGETAATRTAHVAHYAAVAAAGAAELAEGPLPATVARMDRSRANLLAAMDAALASGDPDTALTIAADVALFWQINGRYDESVSCLRHVLAATADEPTRARARALLAFGQVCGYAMDFTEGFGTAAATRAAELAAANGWGEVLGRALGFLHALRMFADPAGAACGQRAAREAAEAAGDRFGATSATAFLALTLTFGSDAYGEAGPELAALAAAAAGSGSPYWLAWHGMCAGVAAWRQGRLADAAALLGAAVEASWALGDPFLEAYNAMWLAETFVDVGDYPAVERVVARSTGWQDRSCIGRRELVALRRVRAALVQADLPAARARFDEAGPLLRSLPFPFLGIEVGILAARIGLLAGDPVAARAAVGEARAAATGLGTPWFLACVEHTEGRVARAEGDLGPAEDAHHRALAVCAERGFAGLAAETLECLASLATAGGSWAEAARLYGAAGAIREATGLVRPPVDAPGADADSAALAAALGPQPYAAAYAEGAGLTLAEAVAYASRARGERKRPAVGWDSLTPTERQVVALVADGLTNPAIGKRLFITTGTVKVHLHNIFCKLGITRRAELAARATERRLADRT